MPKRYKYELRELVEGSRFTSCTCDVDVGGLPLAKNVYEVVEHIKHWGDSTTEVVVKHLNNDKVMTLDGRVKVLRVLENDMVVFDPRRHRDFYYTSGLCEVASTRQNIMTELNDMLRSTMPLVKERIRATNEYERVKTLIRMAYEFGRAEQEYRYAFRDGLKHWRRAHGSTEETEEW